MKPLLAIALFVAAHLAAGSSDAKLREEQLDVPVQVTDSYGKEIRHTIKVTVFSDDAVTGKRPLVMINHGRAGDAQGRLALDRARYTAASRWFVARGFVVAVPTRIGYGVTAGEDVEDSGGCGRKRFTPTFVAAAKQMADVLAAMRERPDVAPDRAVIVGQSVGGASTVAFAAMNPPGVVAAVNFAGGGGGDPKGSPGRPCSPAALERSYAEFGKSARVPMLWVYTENDKYWGAKLPGEWHKAYTAGGAPAQFVQLPPHGEDGHALFTDFPQAWQPLVADFLRAQGFSLQGPTP